MKKAVQAAAILLAGVLVAGCATGGSRAKENQTALQTRVDSLETQVASLNQRLEELSQQQAAPVETNFSSRSASSASRSAKIRLTVRQTQRALAAAGFYKGSIDGKEGPQTKKAVKAFQQDQGLKSDGVVGSATAQALAKYIEE